MTPQPTGSKGHTWYTVPDLSSAVHREPRKNKAEKLKEKENQKGDSGTKHTVCNSGQNTGQGSLRGQHVDTAPCLILYP